MDLTIHHTVAGDNYERATGSFEVRTKADVDKLLEAITTLGKMFSMPKGPNGEKRPADVIDAAVKVARIATGEIEETPPQDQPAASLGRKGGAARAQALSPERRSEIAKKAAAKRWSKP